MRTVAAATAATATTSRVCLSDWARRSTYVWCAVKVTENVDTGTRRARAGTRVIFHGRRPALQLGWARVRQCGKFGREICVRVCVFGMQMGWDGMMIMSLCHRTAQ